MGLDHIVPEKPDYVSLLLNYLAHRFVFIINL